MDFVGNDDEEPKEEIKVCQTNECAKLGKRMKQIMNSQIDPCQDFYEYSCGKWQVENDRQSQLAIQSFEGRQKIMKLFKTYQPVTNSERIAKVVHKKCLENKGKDYTGIDQSVWNSKDLTKILIEAAKVDPIDTGFLIHIIIPYHKEDGENKLTLIFASRMGESKDDKNIPDLSPDDTTTFTFMNLQEYLKGLLPEEYRGTEMNWKLKIVKDPIAKLNQFAKVNSTENIRQTIKEKWQEKLESYLLHSQAVDNYAYCFSQLEKLFPGTLAMIFIKTFVPPKHLQKANQIFLQLKYVFKEMIDENDWMDDNLKKQLKKELNAYKASLGEPDEHKDIKNIDQMYKRVEKLKPAEQQGYLELVRNLLAMNSEETFLRVARRDVMTYSAHPFQASFHYIGVSHRTSFPAYSALYPYIDDNLPVWNVIASFGLILAHEIGHAFDAGAFLKNQFLEDYEISSLNREEFKNRVRCISDKYSKYQFYDGRHSNGTHTSDEDTADKLGIDLSYRLFKKFRSFEKIPGFENKTIDQQFFQRMAIVFCGIKLTEPREVTEQIVDVHSYRKFRINGIMSNSEAFANAYSCAKNTPMNPDQKCPFL
ncbi:unnamed protein product [Caenorhabditis angaria]|uniref:Peptidase M13 C-terminal domain-containing protein n=1 Tax=Caenorhabditis angaria TaxID=860376 RepID=A0A9P1IDW6_9PELO|nr:unnamed protein product [Caenorhabditis angaria]